MIQKLQTLFRSEGAIGIIRALGRRIVVPRLRCYRFCKPYFEGQYGLEIGGPSPVFSRHGLFPVYRSAGRIDNCNFSRQSVWVGAIQEGATFRYDKEHAPGNQHIAEAVDLRLFPSESYDFVLSSHALEHTANPLLALSEWMRVLKVHGMLVLVLPHKDGMFDHRRPVTELSHLMQDFELKKTEADLTHVPEILEFHDMARDPEAGDFKSFKERSERNLENRCLHHHVFDTQLAVKVVNHLGLQIYAVEATRPYHIFVVAQKIKQGERPQNKQFLGNDTVFRRHSLQTNRL